MSRRRYVVAYDIREPKRLRQVHSAMKAFGYPLQYSVFVCDLDGMERVSVGSGTYLVPGWGLVFLKHPGSPPSSRFL